jgi:hypothetical protein
MMRESRESNASTIGAHTNCRSQRALQKGGPFELMR